ncbi:MAG: flavin reductase family protein [Muribaculaceae bacterium]|nr:flavin reductase family protein [Muribaculaceae bacterium]
MKQNWRPGTMIYPLPALLVSCGAVPEEYNLFTAAWTGTVCSDPAMCYVSIRPERHSHDIVERNMAFTLNLTNRALARATDWCGVRSGRDCNKWKEMGLTPVKGVTVPAPYIDEAPMSIECQVRDIVRLGTHDMFLAEVMNVIADDRYIDPTTGAFDMARADLIAYCHGHYHTLGDELGHFGWSVRKKPKERQ